MMCFDSWRAPCCTGIFAAGVSSALESAFARPGLGLARLGVNFFSAIFVSACRLALNLQLLDHNEGCMGDNYERTQRAHLFSGVGSLSAGAA
jgi:hypothetical protein